MNFLRRLVLQEKKNLMTARVSILLKSRASLTCFRACSLPGRAKDLSASLYNPKDPYRVPEVPPAFLVVNQKDKLPCIPKKSLVAMYS